MSRKVSKHYLINYRGFEKEENTNLINYRGFEKKEKTDQILFNSI